MTREKISREDYRSLAEFRYQIRCYLHFSENAARLEGLNPAQHQLLLVLKGIPAGVKPTIRNLADRLILRHHSTVELIDRLERHGSVRRIPGKSDRRQVLIQITPRGESLLERLSLIHRAELRSGGASLMKTLQSLVETKPDRRCRTSL